jgi:ABC-type sugar transport system ATPase subunit
MGGYSSRLAEKTYARAEKVLNLRGGHMSAPVTALSGGNRQKIFLGRWLLGDTPRLLLLAQPTQGVDVGARADIARALRELADAGVTVLVASSESDEIELLCDRALTLHGTQCIETQPGPDWSERLLKSLVENAPTHQGVQH